MGLRNGGTRPGGTRNVSEIGVTAIPDSGDLHINYDATELSQSDGDSGFTWTAEVGPDLTATGGATYKTGVKNGNAVVRYDGTGDGHSGTLPSSQPQPNHLFIVFSLSDGATSGFEAILSTDDSNDRQDLGNNAGSSWEQNANTALRGGTIDTNWHIAALLFDGANSVLRIDGSQVESGDAGTGSHTSVSVGWLAWNSGNYAPVDVGEILGYPQDKSSKVTEIEAYLNDKWAVF